MVLTHHGCKTFVIRTKDVKTPFYEKQLKNINNVEQKELFAKLLGPIEKLLIKQYRT